MRLLEKYYFFDSNESIGDERWYSAADWSKVLSKFLENGIYVEGDNLTVTAYGTSMAVTVGTGVAFIDGHMYENDAPVTLNVDAAEATLDRIDLVVLRLDLTEQNRYIKAFVVKGEAATAPVAPVPVATTFIKEIPLAEIRVTAGKSIVDQTQIKDRRPDDFVDPFMDGSRITHLETVLANLLQDDIGAYNKTETDDKFLTKTGASSGYIPYSGALQGVDLNGKEISNMFGSEWLREGNNWYTRLDTLAGYGRLMTRNLADKSPISDFFKWTKDGILSFPKQSFIKLSKGADFQVASSTETKLDPFAVTDDTNTEFSIGLSTFYPKESGIYLISGEIMYTAVNAQISYFRLMENGIFKDYICKGYNARFFNGASIVKLTAGKAYEFYLWHNAGVTVTVDQVSIAIAKIA